MTQYKYHLDKTSKKFNCPKCNKKRFVKYVETETNITLKANMGVVIEKQIVGMQLYPIITL